MVQQPSSFPFKRCLICSKCVLCTTAIKIQRNCNSCFSNVHTQYVNESQRRHAAGQQVRTPLLFATAGSPGRAGQRWFSACVIVRYFKGKLEFCDLVTWYWVRNICLGTIAYSDWQFADVCWCKSLCLLLSLDFSFSCCRGSHRFAVMGKMRACVDAGYGCDNVKCMAKVRGTTRILPTCSVIAKFVTTGKMRGRRVGMVSLPSTIRRRCSFRRGVIFSVTKINKISWNFRNYQRLVSNVVFEISRSCL